MPCMRAYRRKRAGPKYWTWSLPFCLVDGVVEARITRITRIFVFADSAFLRSGLLHAARYAKGGAEGCEYGDEKLNDVLPNFFFHDAEFFSG